MRYFFTNIITKSIKNINKRKNKNEKAAGVPKYGFRPSTRTSQTQPDMKRLCSALNTGCPAQSQMWNDTASAAFPAKLPMRR